MRRIQFECRCALYYVSVKVACAKTPGEAQTHSRATEGIPQALALAEVLVLALALALALAWAGEHSFTVRKSQQRQQQQ